MAGAAVLPSLRDELVLMPGPTTAEGWPSWTLLDPIRNRFFRLGWLEFEILSRWDRGSPEEVAESVSAETTLDVHAEDVMDLIRFAAGNHLMRPIGPAGTAVLEESYQAQRRSWAEWLLHNYLFFRIPLVRPDRMLARLLPGIAWAFSPWFLAATILAGMAGILLAGRQWDVFIRTLVSTATAEGLAGYAVTLTLAKVLHELGHAFTTKRFGCRVPTMGVAFLVMWPVLYTDTTEAWKLPSRKARLAVDAAGILTELALAAWATLAWSLLPDGQMRSMAFMLATTTWISTIVINSSPFMRFDGYFLAMDALDMPNLHARAFAVARWRLREMLFHLGEEAPEIMTAWRRRGLIAFAVATWTYRLVVFLGIALLVYHFFIKIIGIGLFAVEVGWFVVLPIVSELAVWWRKRSAAAASRRTRLTLGFVGLALVLLTVPWQGRVFAPALLEAAGRLPLYAPSPGRVTALPLANGQTVHGGDVIAVLASPDLDYRLAIARTRVKELRYETSSITFESDFREQSQVLEQELAGAEAEAAGLEKELGRLTVRAPQDGVYVDLPPDLKVGQWVPAKETLGLVRSAHGAVLEAYVGEDDVDRLTIGDWAHFFPEEPGRPVLAARVTAIDRVAATSLALPELASVNGGGVPSRRGKDAVIPDRAVYTVRLKIADGGLVPDVQLRGTVVIHSRSRSLIERAAKAVAAVLIREAGL